MPAEAPWTGLDPGKSLESEWQARTSNPVPSTATSSQSSTLAPPSSEAHSSLESGVGRSAFSGGFAHAAEATAAISPANRRTIGPNDNESCQPLAISHES